MNLIDESLEENKKKDSSKMIARIILVMILILVILIISIFSYLMYIEKGKLKVSLNGKVNDEVLNLLNFEQDGTIYLPIRSIATILGYNSYNGEYNNASEDISKCYVKSENEIVNFSLNSNKIYSLNLGDSSGNYSYSYMDKPVKAINGVLYITTEGMQKAFNSIFEYDKNINKIQIYTMPYLISLYEKKVLDYGFEKINSNFRNNKAILQGMLIVEKNNKMGLIEANTGTEILECKYDKILYQEDIGDFLVTSNNKVGIMTKNKEIKVDILYDNIELMDLDAGLYCVKNENQYGVIDLKGNTKIYTENAQIGIDISRFSKNNLKSKYILAGNLIPVKKSDKWGFFDIKGNQLVDFEYDSIGYIAKSSKEALNLLLIPDYNVIVVCKDSKYTLLNEYGKQPFNAFVDDIYMTISAGQKHYYMTANDATYDVEDYLDRIGVKTNNQQNSSQKNNNNGEQQENQEQNGNQQENQEQNGNQQGDQEQNGEQQENQEQNGEQQEGQEQNGDQQENQEQNQPEQQENQGQSLIGNNNEEN